MPDQKTFEELLQQSWSQDAESLANTGSFAAWSKTPQAVTPLKSELLVIDNNHNAYRQGPVFVFSLDQTVRDVCQAQANSKDKELRVE